MNTQRYRRPRTQSWRWRVGPRQAHHDLVGSVRSYASREPSLELGDYLRELRVHAERLRHHPELTVRRFVELLEAPLLGPLAAPESAEATPGAARGYEIWDAGLRELITDFDALEQSSELDKQGRWLFMCGADAPSGLHWYNFNVYGFLSRGSWGLHDTGGFRTTMTWQQCADFLLFGACYE